MKKILAVIIFSLVCFNASAATMPYSLGYEIGINGISENGEGFTGINFGLVYTPFSFTTLNPSLRAEGTYVFNENSAGFQDFRGVMEIDLVRTINHPFDFLGVNILAWCPSVGFGYQKDGFYADLSLLKFMDKDFIYEWFSPFIVFEDRIEKWGIVLFRFSPLVV